MKIKRFVFLLMASVIVTAQLMGSSYVFADDASSGKPYAQCYIKTTGDGLTLDGDCKATYPAAHGSHGTTLITMNEPPGGNFLDDYGSCFIVNLDSKNYDDVNCDDAIKRSALWLNPSDTGQTVISSIDWSTRIRFRGPTRILDTVTNINYGTTEIFDDGSEAFLRDGSGHGDNANDAVYFYAPLDNAGNPLYFKAGSPGCYPGFRLRLGANGDDAALSAWLPKMNFAGTQCEIIEGTAAKNGHYNDNDDTIATEYHIGSWGGQDMDGTSYGLSLDGNDIRWGTIGAGFYWLDKDTINAFDGEAVFKPASEVALTNAQEDWQANPNNSQLSDEEVSAEGWRFFISESCTDAYLAISPDNTKVYPVKVGDGAKRWDEGPFDQCVWGRNVKGQGSAAFETSGVPTFMAFVENATLEEGTNNEGGDSAGSETRPPGGEEGAENKKTCSTEGGPLGWILCPVLTVLDEATQEMERQIQGFLFVETDRFTTDSGAYQAWSTFRGVATVIIVIIALIMIFSQAMGDGIFDNYSVKKLLPRLLLAGIAIQLSWWLITELVNIFNYLGNGIGGLMLNAFSTQGLQIGTDTNLRDVLGGITSEASGSDVAAGLGFSVLVVMAPMLMGGIVAVALGMAAAVLVGLVTLIVRDMIILLGVVLAPVGIAMSVLPGTQKTSKWWWESLEKALAMYPLVMGLLAVGKVLALLLFDSATPENEEGISVTYLIAGVIAWYLPFFFLPKALQAGGTALNKISGFAGDKSKGLFNVAKKYNERRDKMRGQLKQEKRAIQAGKTGIRSSWARNRLRSAAGAPMFGAMPLVPGREKRKNRYNSIVAGANAKAVQQAVAEEKAALQESSHYSSPTALLNIAQTGPPAQARAAADRLVEMGRDKEVRMLRDGHSFNADGTVDSSDTTVAKNSSGRSLFGKMQVSGGVESMRAKAPDIVNKDGADDAFKSLPVAKKMEEWSPASLELALRHNNGQNVQGILDAATNDPDFAASLDPEKTKILNQALWVQSGGTGDMPPGTMLFTPAKKSKG